MTQPIRHAEDHRPAEAGQEQEEDALQEPSWFFHPANGATREELMTRYRKTFNLPEDPLPLPLPSRPRLTPRYRDLVGAEPQPPAQFLFAREENGGGETRRPSQAARGSANLRRNYALAAVIAMLSGTTIGLVTAQYDTIKARALDLLAQATPGAKPEPPLAVLKTAAAVPPVQGSVIGKKPVATATLEVADATGQTNSLIPLVLHAAPESQGSDLLLKISGLPASAYLTSGHRGDDNIWALDVNDLKDVKLVVPEARASEIDLAVAAFEKKTGELAAPVKTMTVALSDVVVQPASAPPPQRQAQPASAPRAGNESVAGEIPAPTSLKVALGGDAAQTSQITARGDALMKSGDIDGARRAYAEAWDSGAADGALGLARSYDPVVLSTLKLNGVTPDASQALDWYGRAAAAGAPEASDAIVRLKFKR